MSEPIGEAFIRVKALTTDFMGPNDKAAIQRALLAEERLAKASNSKIAKDTAKQAQSANSAAEKSWRARLAKQITEAEAAGKKIAASGVQGSAGSLTPSFSDAPIQERLTAVRNELQREVAATEQAEATKQRAVKATTKVVLTEDEVRLKAEKKAADSLAAHQLALSRKQEFSDQARRNAKLRAEDAGRRAELANAQRAARAQAKILSATGLQTPGQLGAAKSANAATAANLNRGLADQVAAAKAAKEAAAQTAAFNEETAKKIKASNSAIAKSFKEDLAKEVADQKIADSERVASARAAAARIIEANKASALAAKTTFGGAFGKQFENTGAGLGKSIANAVKGVPKDIFGFVTNSAKFATVGVVGLGVAISGIGLVAAAKTQAAETSFKALAGAIVNTNGVLADTTAATNKLSDAQRTAISDNFLKKLIDIANNSAISQTALQDTSQALLALNFNGDQTIGTIRDIGNALAASGKTGAGLNDDLRGVVVAFSQISGAGRLLAQDLNQITTRIPSVSRTKVYDELAKRLKLVAPSAKAGSKEMQKAEVQVRKLAKAGEIASSVAIPALLKVLEEVPGAAANFSNGFKDALERQNETIVGRFESLKDNIRNSLREAFLPLSGGAGGKSPIDKLADDIRDAILPINVAIIKLGKPLAAFTSQVIDLGLKVLPHLSNLIGSVFGGISKGLADVTKNAKKISDAFSSFGDVLKSVGIGPAIGEAFQAIGESIKPILVGIGGIAVGLTPALSIAADLARIFIAVLTPAVQGAALAFGAFGKVLAPFAALLRPITDFIVKIASSQVGTIILGIVGGLAGFGIAAAAASAAMAALDAGLVAAAGGMGTLFGLTLRASGALLGLVGAEGAATAAAVRLGIAEDGAAASTGLLAGAAASMAGASGVLSLAFLGPIGGAIALGGAVGYAAAKLFKHKKALDDDADSAKRAGDAAAIAAQKYLASADAIAAGAAVIAAGTSLIGQEQGPSGLAGALGQNFQNQVSLGNPEALAQQAKLDTKAASDKLAEALAGIGDGAKAGTDKAKSAAQTAIDSFKEKLHNILIGLDKDFKDGLIAGDAKNAAKTLSDLAGKIAEAFHDAKKAKPSKLLSFIKSESKELQKLIKERDAIVARLAAAKDASDTAFSDAKASGNIATLAQALADAAASAEKTTTDLSKLRILLPSVAGAAGSASAAIAAATARTNAILQRNKGANNLNPTALLGSGGQGVEAASVNSDTAKLQNALDAKLAALKKYNADIQTLIQKGLGKTSLTQILNAGVEGGGAQTAALLAGASKAAIDAINATQAQIDEQAKNVASKAGDVAATVGEQVALGLVNGLKANKKELIDEITALVDAIIKRVKDTLQVKSPSRVMHKIGVFAGQGLLGGLHALVPHIEAAAGKMAKASIPNLDPINVGAARIGADPTTVSGLRSQRAAAVGAYGNVDNSRTTNNNHAVNIPSITANFQQMPGESHQSAMDRFSRSIANGVRR